MLFDLDGTVLDGGGLPDAMRATCEALAADLPGIAADDLVAANTAAWQRLWPEVEDEYMLGGTDGLAVGADAWRATLAACGVRDDAVLRRAVEEWDRRERASFRLFPDVLPALSALQRIGIRAGMVTNGAAAVQRLKLETTGLAGRFDPVVISSDAGVKKPDAAIFAQALLLAGTAAADAWYVGDNLWHDMPGARETGIRAVWIDRHGWELRPEWPQPDLVLTSLAELPDALDQEPR